MYREAWDDKLQKGKGKAKTYCVSEYGEMFTSSELEKKKTIKFTANDHHWKEAIINRLSCESYLKN